MLEKARRFRLFRSVISLVSAALLLALTLQLARIIEDQFAQLNGFAPVLDPNQIVRLIEIAMLIIAALITGWFSLVALLFTACFTTRLVHHTWNKGERLLHALSPKVLRTAISAALSVGIGAATLAPAHANPDENGTEINLSWSAHSELDRAESSPPAVSARKSPAGPPSVPREKPPNQSSSQTHAAVTHAETVIVARGDSLWKISAKLLPAGSSDAEIDTAWRTIYQKNTDVIGPDPDLLLPGMQLTLPDPHVFDSDSKETP